MEAKISSLCMPESMFTSAQSSKPFRPGHHSAQGKNILLCHLGYLKQKTSEQVSICIEFETHTTLQYSSDAGGVKDVTPFLHSFSEYILKGEL